MTENKRFTPRLYETMELFLVDNETNCFYRVEDSFGNVELLCERLNKLVGENVSLKQELDYYKRLHDTFKGDSLSLVEENEGLKEFKEKALHEVYDLNKENEQLKSDIIAIEKRADNVYDKNNQLKEVVDGLKDVINRQNEWEKKAIDEIGQLKQKNKYNEEFIADVCADCERLTEENEELKKGKWQCRLCGFTGTIEHICRKRGDVE